MTYDLESCFHSWACSSYALQEPFTATRTSQTSTLAPCRAAESVQKVTSTGWKQAQQGLKGLTGEPLQVSTFFCLCRTAGHRVPWAKSCHCWTYLSLPHEISSLSIVLRGKVQHWSCAQSLHARREDVYLVKDCHCLSHHLLLVICPVMVLQFRGRPAIGQPTSAFVIDYSLTELGPCADALQERGCQPAMPAHRPGVLHSSGDWRALGRGPLPAGGF